jgi:hypothetical protein
MGKEVSKIKESGKLKLLNRKDVDSTQVHVSLSNMCSPTLKFKILFKKLIKNFLTIFIFENESRNKQYTI